MNKSENEVLIFYIKFNSNRFFFFFLYLSSIGYSQDSNSDTSKTGLFHKSSKKDKKEKKKKTKKNDSKSNNKYISNHGVHNPKDTSKTVLSVELIGTAIPIDTTHQDRENSPLDIGDYRGLYIVDDKGMLQMRILGSVRYSAFYDFDYLESKNSFNTYEIRTGEDSYRLPNYYNSLNFSRFGFGVSLSGIFDLKHSDQILYQATLGNAIAHFLNPFGGSGSDTAYDHLNQEFKGLGTYGGFISYGHHWPHNISYYFSFGIAALDNRDFQVGSDYNFSYDFSANAFWNVVEGLKVGLEVLYGQRFDVDNNSGDASRIWALFYYDF